MSLECMYKLAISDVAVEDETSAAETGVAASTGNPIEFRFAMFSLSLSPSMAYDVTDTRPTCLSSPRLRYSNR